MISRAPVWAVFLLFACLYLLSIGRGFYSSDGEVMFKTTAALVERGTFALAPDPGLPQIVRGRSGQYYSKYDPGLPLIGVPFYVTGDRIGKINHAHRARLAATTYLLIPALAAAGALAALAAVSQLCGGGGKAFTTEDTENTERSSRTTAGSGHRPRLRTTHQHKIVGAAVMNASPLNPPSSPARGGTSRRSSLLPLARQGEGAGGIGALACFPDDPFVDSCRPGPHVASQGEQGGAGASSENRFGQPNSVLLKSSGASRKAAPVRRWLWAVLAVGLATPLWVYARELFPEAVLACALTVAVMAVSFSLSLHAGKGIEGEPSSCSLLWLVAGGAAFGIGVLTRAALAIYTPALALLIVRRAEARQPRDMALRLAAFAAGALPFALILLWHNALRFGDPLQTGYAGEGFTTPLWKGIAGLLVSPGKGIALYAPPLILSAILWRRFRRADQGSAEFLALAWGTALIVYGMWWAWDGGWCWGPRLLVPLMPLSCLPLTVLPEGRRWRVALIGLVALGIAVQVPGVLTTVIPHYAEVSGSGPSGVDRIDFVPRDSPLVDAVDRLLHGETEPLGMFHLRDMGLPPTWTVGMPLLLIVGVITGVYGLVRRQNRWF